MFTHVVDDAINRVEFEGGEVAAVYDDCASNPLEDFEIKGLGIHSHERNTIDYDPDRTLKDYQGLLDDKGDALYDIETTFSLLRKEYGEAWWEKDTDDMPEYEDWAQDIIDDIDAIDDYDDQLESFEVLEYTAYEEYGHPVYTVVVDTPLFKSSWACANTMDKDFVSSLAKEYAAWANGSVYVIGFTDSDGETEYAGNVVGIDPYDDEALIKFARENF